MDPRFASHHLIIFLSPSGSAFVLADYRARIAQQVLGPCFACLYMAQRVFSLSPGLASRNKALVYAMLLSTRLSVTPHRVAVLHRRTRLWSTLCLSPPCSAGLLADLLACTAEQTLGLLFPSHHQGQRVFSPSRGLTLKEKAWVHALPLSTRISVSPCQFAG